MLHMAELETDAWSKVAPVCCPNRKETEIGIQESGVLPLLTDDQAAEDLHDGVEDVGPKDWQRFYMGYHQVRLCCVHALAVPSPSTVK